MVTVPPKLTRRVSPLGEGVLSEAELLEEALLGVELPEGVLDGWEEGAEDGTEDSEDGAWEALELSEVVKEPSTGGGPAGTLEDGTLDDAPEDGIPPEGVLEGALLTGRLEEAELSCREDTVWELWDGETSSEDWKDSSEEVSSESSSEISDHWLLSGKKSTSRGVPPMWEGSAGSSTSISLAQATEPTEKAADTARPAAVKTAAMTRR